MRSLLPRRSLVSLSILALLPGCGLPSAGESPEVDGTAPRALDTRLSCNLAFSYAPPATVNVGLIASQVTSVVGLSDSMGGVGVKLELVNN